LLGSNLVFFFNGCSLGGNKELVCTNTQRVKIASTKEMVFKSNKIDNVKLTLDITPDSNLKKDNWKYVEDTYLNYILQLIKKEQKCLLMLIQKNKKYSVIIESNLSKSSKEDLEANGIADLAGAEDTYEQAKKI